ncbi:MAG: hypothetical protein IKS65_10770 [Bacteroidales bacterium]|nr:hypothetical protein [Bacteroidales bacterium]
MLLLLLATGLIFPSAAVAQSDGFFRNISYNTDRDGESIYNLNNQTFGQDVVPLGSGLLIFIALGASYAVVRRRLKRTTIFFIALSLLFGLNQCKKKVDTINPNNLGDETVYIRVNVNNGTKHIVYPNTGEVVYSEGDKIYVGNGDQYLGELTYESGGFSGEITKPAVGDYLHFYFVGGLTLENFSLTSTKVSIKDQSSSLPVLSYGKSNRAYTEGNATYSCTLLNKCALVKFVLAKGTNYPVKLIDLATSATINFHVTNPDNAITEAGYNDDITLYSGSETEKWAILLPHNAVNGANVVIGDDYYKVNVPKIEANDYISDGIGIDNTGVAISVSENSKVYFSPGNLQYNPSTQSWKFADNQYVFIGSANSNISPTYNGWLDLFGWGTGDNPTNSSVENDDYANFTDWGDNCGDPTGHGYEWKTLNSDQWLYLFQHHTYGRCTVHGVFGYVVLPDGATADIPWSYTDDEWEALEAQGALFFPAAGSREGTIVSSVGLSGGYWSSTKYFYNNDDAIWLYIYENDYYVNGCEKSIGSSVRLVRDASYTDPLNKASK